MYGRDPYIFANHDSIPEPIMDVILGILKSWDMPTTDYKYISWFHPGGILHVAPEPTQGEEALKQLHDSFIDPQKGPLVDLQHFLDKVYLLPASEDGKTEAVFTGKLDNHLRNGETVTTDFATRLIMSEKDGVLKTDHLRVYSDTSALYAAIGKMMAQGNE